MLESSCLFLGSYFGNSAQNFIFREKKLNFPYYDLIHNSLYLLSFIMLKMGVIFQKGLHFPVVPIINLCCLLIFTRETESDSWSVLLAGRGWSRTTDPPSATSGVEITGVRYHNQLSSIFLIKIKISLL